MKGKFHFSSSDFTFVILVTHENSAHSNCRRGLKLRNGGNPALWYEVKYNKVTSLSGYENSEILFKSL